MAIKTVGIGKGYSTIPAAIAAAQSGDTIQVDAGTYANQYASIAKNLTLEGPCCTDQQADAVGLFSPAFR